MGPIVSNAVSYTHTFAEWRSMLCHHKFRGQQEMLGGDGQVYGIYCGDGFTVYMYVKTHQVVDVPYVHLFVCQSHLKEKRKKLGD